MRDAQTGASRPRQPDLKVALERRLDELPVLPTVVAQLMVLDRTADDYFDQLLELIQSEPNFAARVLSAANSAASAPRSPVTNLRSAVARLGSQGASNLVVALSVTSVFVPTGDWEKSLWRHAIQVGLAARALAEVSSDGGVHPDDAYTCGLLHDVGRFVMFQEAPDQLRLVDEGDWDTPDLLVAQEETICGLNHAELGAMACQKWGIPELVRETVRTHHSAHLEQVSPAAELARIVRFADFAMFPSLEVDAAGYADATTSTIEDELLPRLPDSIELTPERLRELISEVATSADEMSRSLGVA